MNVLDLFSGIGGFSLGLERAGMRTVAFVEIDPYCRAVLRKHWPGVPIFEDIKGLTLSNRSDSGSVTWKYDSPNSTRYVYTKPPDLICGGFPCQPWSVAGKRRGHDDDRDLWPQMLRLVGEIRPRWVLGENVPGLDDAKYMALDGCLSDLEALGYAAQTLEMPACAVDAPHRRARLWIVAHANGAWQPQQEWSGSEQRRRTINSGEDVADANRDNGHGRGGDVQVGRKRSASETQEDGDATGAEWFAGASICRVDDGLPPKLDGDRIDEPTSKTRPDEALQGVRQKNAEEAISRNSGKYEHLSSSPLLRPAVHGKGFHEGESVEGWISSEGAQNAPEIMCAMREFGEALRSSHQWRLVRQQPVEFDDAVQFLSHGIASRAGRHREKAGEAALQGLREAILQAHGTTLLHSQNEIAQIWQSLADEEANWCIVAACLGPFWSEWPGVPRVAKGIPRRVDRLRALGNAVVPQVVEQIGCAIMRADG